MKLLFGTINKAKLEIMKKRIQPLGIEIVGLSDFDCDFPDVDESGNSPLENARIKALEYFRISKIPTFSCDSGLYIDDMSDENQPGIHVRNVKGKYLNDEEMIEYYSSLAKDFGGKMVAQYKNAISLVLSETEIYEYMGDDIAGDKFIICDKPHSKRVDGFPLDTLSIHINSGKYYFDIGKLRGDSISEDSGFQNFFRRVIKLEQRTK